jgi:hypothetical protein
LGTNFAILGSGLALTIGGDDEMFDSSTGFVDVVCKVVGFGRQFDAGSDDSFFVVGIFFGFSFW